MTRAEIQAIIAQAAQAWITGNAEAFAALFAPDGEFAVPGKIHQGRETIREVAANFAARYSNVTINIRRMIVNGDQAVVEWHWEDTKNATSVRNKADDAIVIDFKDGLIIRWREYIDTKTPTSGEL